jgi:DNA-binding CsgD family transcriptional regulator
MEPMREAHAPAALRSPHVRTPAHPGRQPSTPGRHAFEPEPMRQSSMTRSLPPLLSDPAPPDVSTLLEALDLLGQGFGILDAGGRWIFRSRVLEESLGVEAAARLRALTTADDRSAPAAREFMADAPARSLPEVPTPRGPCRLRVVRIRDMLAVCLEPSREPGPPEEELRSRFGLTPREATIALLLREGKSNAEIARTLFISPHTARTHVARVLEKLGARSRSRVGEILRSAIGR